MLKKAFRRRNAFWMPWNLKITIVYIWFCSGLFKVKVIMSWSVHMHRIHHFVETGNPKMKINVKKQKHVSKVYNKNGDYYECWICGMYYLGSVVSYFRNHIWTSTHFLLPRKNWTYIPICNASQHTPCYPYHSNRISDHHTTWADFYDNCCRTHICHLRA